MLVPVSVRISLTGVNLHTRRRGVSTKVLNKPEKSPLKTFKGSFTKKKPATFPHRMEANRPPRRWEGGARPASAGRLPLRFTSAPALKPVGRGAWGGKPQHRRPFQPRGKGRGFRSFRPRQPWRPRKPKSSRARNFWSLRKWGLRRARFLQTVNNRWWGRLQARRRLWFTRRKALLRHQRSLGLWLMDNSKHYLEPRARRRWLRRVAFQRCHTFLRWQRQQPERTPLTALAVQRVQRWQLKVREYLRSWGGVFSRRRRPKVRFISRQRRRFKLYRSFAHQAQRYLPYHRLLRREPGMPRYINYRQLFQNQIYEKQSFRKLFRLTHWQLVKHFRKALAHGKRLFDVLFIKYFEFRLDTVVYRANMASSYLQARRWVKAGRFLVNNRVITRPNFRVTIGDCILPQLHLLVRRDFHAARLEYRPVQAGQYPNYLMFNERVPVAMVVANPDIQRIYHTLPVRWQFIMLALASRYR